MTVYFRRRDQWKEVILLRCATWREPLRVVAMDEGESLPSKDKIRDFWRLKGPITIVMEKVERAREREREGFWCLVWWRKQKEGRRRVRESLCPDFFSNLYNLNFLLKIKHGNNVPDILHSYNQ